ncbi:uncharacterized protein LOC128554201, partial [Mercenaria mercenaria]|uniref:uncharacterized protein LOC128554201 n=1 Tax=Mercenaria mercenaria TaxID=6596 RepID=UPI00234F51BF
MGRGKRHRDRQKRKKSSESDSEKRSSKEFKYGGLLTSDVLGAANTVLYNSDIESDLDYSQYEDTDIFSICVTHLTENKVIDVEGYVWYGNNRKNIHVNAVRGSGGVGILVKSWVIEMFDITIVENAIEGILALQLKCRSTDCCSLIVSAYLPPENSVWGRDAQTFFAHILSLIYINSECDTIFLAADFNARIGSLSDILQDVDSLPARVPIDNVVNQHGRELIDFLIDSKFCTLNSRFQNDNFTSISMKGKSVVDYICVPHDVFQQCQSFSVITIQSFVDENDLHGLIGQRSCLPDHSVLLVRVSLNIDISRADRFTNNPSTPTSFKYKLNHIPTDFMNRDIARLAILEVIGRIESARDTQFEIDSIYCKLCDTILNEMNHSIPRYNASNRTKKRNKNAKPYWNEELTDLWNAMGMTENEFLKCNGPRRIKSQKRLDYVLARNRFNKLLRKTEREFKRSISVDIEDMSTSNPNELWDKIKHLGPKRDSSIPVEIIDEQGHVVTDENVVSDRWKCDFANLYNGDDNEEFDNRFYDRAKIHRQLLELNIVDPLYTPNEQLKNNITLEEIVKIVMSANSKSACGIDNIPYAVLKYPPVIAALHKLFQLVFDTNIIPSEWRKSVIFPILKDKNSDKRLPLNYRGVSLLSCISKLYSSFINKRISYYLEESDLLADEQNGFRRGRSCEDHVFTLSSLVRNHDNLHTAFIDLKKAFDFVDRDMLLYKLLLNGIDGKVYNAVK